MNSQPKADDNRTETDATLATIQLRIEALITLVLMLIGAVVVLCGCVIASSYGLFTSFDSTISLAMAAVLLFAFIGLLRALGKVIRASIEDRENFYDPNWRPPYFR